MCAIALTIFEDKFCPDCGEPKERAWNPDQSGWYEAHTVECAGCATRHEYAASQKESNPAEKVYLVDTRPVDLPLMPLPPD